MMVLLVMAAMLAMAGAWLISGEMPPAAHIHLAFALGVMPMIMAAMLHFVPVLTRTRAASRRVASLPALAWTGGTLVTAFFIFSLPEIWRSIAALPALAAGFGLGLWQIKRSRAALGGAHPGVRWYLAALICLGESLLAVLSMSLWPEQYQALKRLHLHLNLFGFVGLTAIGTLQVLLPTAAGRPDSGVTLRLHRHLPFALTGTLLIAIGAAWLPLMSWPGLLLWLIPTAHIVRAWMGRFRSHLFCLHGAAPLLAMALSGFVIALIAGGAHGSGLINSTGVAHLFVFSFIFPLVSGAAGQLLPLWIKPGRQTEWHARARQRLTFASGVRALLFFLAGTAAGFNWVSYLALAAMLAFALLAVSLLRLRIDE